MRTSTLRDNNPPAGCGTRRNYNQQPSGQCPHPAGDNFSNCPSKPTAMPIPTILDHSAQPLVCRISLAGSNTDNTRDGRIWLQFSESSGSVTASIYRRSTMQVGDLVAQGSSSSPLIELSEANDSGLSGVLELATTAASLIAASGTLEAIVQAHVATTSDVLQLEPGLDKLLDDEGRYAGEPGFDWALGEGHRIAYSCLASKLLAAGLSPAEAVASPALLRDPGSLSRAVALLSLHALLLRESARGDPIVMDRAKRANVLAMRELARLTVAVMRTSGQPDLLVAVGQPVVQRS